MLAQDVPGADDAQIRKLLRRGRTAVTKRTLGRARARRSSASRSASLGVLALREATLSTHEAVAGSRDASSSCPPSTKGGEQGQTLAEMVEAQLLTCRLEVTSDLAGPIERLGDGRFRAVLAPALDKTNRRQFRGCIEDWVTITC